MDIMMPELDGISACEPIRSQPKLQSTVIMFLSARGEDFSYVAAFDAGADDYVTKPIKPKVLLSKVKGLLRRFKNSDKEPSVLNLGDLIVDKEEYKVTQNGTSFGLPVKNLNCYSSRLHAQTKSINAKNNGENLGSRRCGWRPNY